MKAAAHPSKQKDRTPTILRLERNNTEIGTLEDKLNSYICEPKTAGLYELMESLKQRLSRMRQHNMEAIKALRQPSKLLDSQKTTIKKQLKDFKELEDSVFEYIGMVRMHC